MITPEKLRDLYDSTRRQGNTTIAMEASRRQGAMIVTGTIRDAISLARQPGVKARSVDDNWRGLRTAVVLDPEVLPHIAEAWATNRARLEARIVALEAEIAGRKEI